MDMTTLAERMTPQAARAFVSAARHVIDAMVIESERVRQAQGPGRTDYNAAGLSHDTPGGGWISVEELRDSSRRLAESIAAERWTDGFLVAVKLIAALGAVA